MEKLIAIKSRNGKIIFRGIVDFHYYHSSINELLRNGYSAGYIGGNEIICLTDSVTTLTYSIPPTSPRYLLQYGNGLFWGIGGNEVDKINAIRFSSLEEIEAVAKSYKETFPDDHKYCATAIVMVEY